MSLSDYKLIRSRRRTIALIIDRTGDLIIRAPYRERLELIQQFVESKKDWIQKMSEKKKKYNTLMPQRCFQDGDQFLYLGTPYILTLTSDITLPLELNTAFMLHTIYVQKAVQVFKDWYKEKANGIIPERVASHAKRLGLSYTGIKITDAKYRWGSCSSRGHLNFTWRLVMAPLSAIDYVAIHELTHLIEQNHSKKFWNKVALHLPEYEIGQRWLKENGHSLTL